MMIISIIFFGSVIILLNSSYIGRPTTALFVKYLLYFSIIIFTPFILQDLITVHSFKLSKDNSLLIYKRRTYYSPVEIKLDELDHLEYNEIEGFDDLSIEFGALMKDESSVKFFDVTHF